MLFQIQSCPFYIVFDTVMIHNNQLSFIMAILQKSKEVYILSDKKGNHFCYSTCQAAAFVCTLDKSHLRTIHLSVNTIAMMKLIGKTLVSSHTKNPWTFDNISSE